MCAHRVCARGVDPRPMPCCQTAPRPCCRPRANRIGMRIFGFFSGSIGVGHRCILPIIRNLPHAEMTAGIAICNVPDCGHPLAREQRDRNGAYGARGEAPHRERDPQNPSLSIRNFSESIEIPRPLAALAVRDLGSGRSRLWKDLERQRRGMSRWQALGLATLDPLGRVPSTLDTRHSALLLFLRRDCVTVDPED